MSFCIACQENLVEILLNFGFHPISNQFLASINRDELKYPFILGSCRKCGLVQLINPISSATLAPKYGWIHYNEPEDHLDSLAEILIQLENTTTASKVLGLSAHDTSLLERLNKSGAVTATELLEKERDLNITTPFAGIESIQEALTLEKSHQIVQKRGLFDVIIARSMLEHAHHPHALLSAVHRMLQPGGYVVFEVPDCTRAIEVGDYTMLWEEHVSYFTPYTLKFLIEAAGFECQLLKVYQTPTLDSMVIVAKKLESRKDDAFSSQENQRLKYEISRSLGYKDLHARQVKGYRNILLNYLQKGDVALLGAGHTAFAFLNMMGLADLVTYVLDDNIHKKGLYFPGTGHVIAPTDILDSGKISLCLLSLSHASEQKIMNSKFLFIANGGKFYSIIPTSHYALEIKNSESSKEVVDES